MKLKFNEKLDYQQDAIRAVVDLLDGQAVQQGQFELSTQMNMTGLQQTEFGLANHLQIDEDKLLTNLQAIQQRNTIELSTVLYGQQDVYDFPNFSVEMETGTGKTYVYLRTIFELAQTYGLKKFIIVVPSVAIREGVTSSLRMMREHFSKLYDNAPFDNFLYSSKDVSKLRQFAIGNEIQIMVINIQAFQKDAGTIADYAALTEAEIKKLNIIHREDDRSGGRRWIEYVQMTRPIVIIDEPQSVDTTSKAQKAINTLNPLFALRYSATHINPYHLLYKLDPLKAYDLKLVKQIEVASIEAASNINQAYLKLDFIGYVGKAKTPSAKAIILEDTPNGTREKSVKLNVGVDLSDYTNRSGYEGFIVHEIYAEAGAEYVLFANTEVLELQQEKGSITDEVLKTQIYQTVEEHFKKERTFQMQGKAIKVLSLFFIDKVANYRVYDDNGQPQNGKLATWFEEAYTEIANKSLFKDLPKRSASAVHNGYFSVDKKKGKVVGLLDTSGKVAKDEDTYELIMRDKERLLTENEPLRFLFSHTALKEGWDNPNVFQICTLREIGSERERRQTLGRGLRLPVNQDGERICDTAVNKLTVIASESFEQYAKSLQADMEKDMGDGFKFGRIQPIAFSQLVPDFQADVIGQEQSKTVWEALRDQGYITKEGDITEKFDPSQRGFKLELPEQLEPLTVGITGEMKRYLFSGRVVNARETATVSYQKRVKMNPDFKVLWEKIGQKTRYQVRFENHDLIRMALNNIAEMPAIKPLSITLAKKEVKLSAAGVEDGRAVYADRDKAIISHDTLPDILAFLQRETDLTRGTLVEILQQCGRLQEFRMNPQAFMTEVAKQIKRALQALIITDIHYERIEGQRYEMQLFEQENIEVYLNRLYQVQYQVEDDEGLETVRTPYDFIEFDSTVERDIAQALDEDETIRFFCKLPAWFKVPTPLGSYNPDWAIVTEDEGKLYLVAESKSTHDASKRRASENMKIKCGKAHFDELGVDFSVGINLQEIINTQNLSHYLLEYAKPKC